MTGRMLEFQTHSTQMSPIFFWRFQHVLSNQWLTLQNPIINLPYIYAYIYIPKNLGIVFIICTYIRIQIMCTYIYIYMYMCVCVCLCISSISGHIWGWFMSVPHQSVYLNFMLQGIGLSKTHGKPWFLESQIGFSFKIPLKPIWWMLMDRPLFSPGLSSMLFWCPSPSSIPGLLGILRLRSWRPGEIVRSHSCPIH